LVAAVIDTEESEIALPLEALSYDVPESVVEVPTEGGQTSNTVFFGWLVMLSGNRSEHPSLDSSMPEPADEYLATYENEFTDSAIGAEEPDFGDIATSRTKELEESDDMSAEDAVFELIGSGSF
jgi:hypothetical protein